MTVGDTWHGEMVARHDMWTSDEAVSRLFAVHYRELVRLAVLILREDGAPEEVVQDAFVRLHTRWHRLLDPDKALAYLRASVVNGCRSALRRRAVSDRYRRTVAVGEGGRLDRYIESSAEEATIDRLTAGALLEALRTLPIRQREAVVLRYYVDLSEAEMAETMGCSRGAVKSHLSRGISALRIRVSLNGWAKG